MVAAAGVAGAAALTSFAGAASARGGTLRIVSSQDVDSLDPALWFAATSWSIGWATCSNLVTYPDRPAPAGSRVVPDAASGWDVLDRGRTYVFHIRRGLRFSNGKPLTAANFAAAINRVLSPTMNTPAVGDADIGPDIVGGQAVIAGKAKTASGIVASGTTLTVRLTAPRPDILARLTLPWFCPIPTDLPLDPAGVDFVPGSGPYYVAGRQVGHQIVLKRNPYYHGSRPGNPDRIVISITGTPESNVALVQKNGADMDFDTIPRALEPQLVARYGLNRSLLRLYGSANFAFYLVLNTSSALLKGNPRLRRAINYAVDRPSLVRAGGFLNSRRTDQLLPSGMPGFRDAHLYPLKGPDLRTARRLAAGHLRSRRAVFYTTPGAFGQTLAGDVRYELEQIGLDVEIKTFAGPVRFQKIETPGEPWDITFGELFADYLDPDTFLRSVYGGPSLTGLEPYGNLSWLDSPDVNRRIQAASRLSGQPRYSAYGRLDNYVLTRYAPIVPVSSMLITWLAGPKLGCIYNHPWYTWDLAALCLK